MHNKKKNKIPCKLQENKPQPPSVEKSNPAVSTTKPNEAKKTIKTTTATPAESIIVQQKIAQPRQPKKKESEQKQVSAKTDSNLESAPMNTTETSIVTSEETKKTTKKGVAKSVAQKKSSPEKKAPLASPANTKRKVDTNVETSEDVPKTTNLKRQKHSEKRAAAKRRDSEAAVPMEVDTEKEVNPTLADGSDVKKDTKSTQIATTDQNKRKRENESQDQEKEHKISKASRKRATKRAKQVANLGTEISLERQDTMMEGVKESSTDEQQVESQKSPAKNPSDDGEVEAIDEKKDSLKDLQTTFPKLSAAAEKRRRKKLASSIDGNQIPMTVPEVNGEETEKEPAPLPQVSLTVPEVIREKTEKESAPLPSSPQTLTKNQKAKLKKQAKKLATEVEPQTQQETCVESAMKPITVTAETNQAQPEEIAVPSTETSKTKKKPKKKQAANALAQDKVEEKEPAEEKAAAPKDIDDIFAFKKSKIVPAKTSGSEEDDKCAMETFVNTITNVKAGKKAVKPKARIEDDGFADSRGSKSRRKTTDDGLPIYQDKELLAVGGGDTAECPFDCKCCI